MEDTKQEFMVTTYGKTYGVYNFNSNGCTVLEILKGIRLATEEDREYLSAWFSLNPNDTTDQSFFYDKVVTVYRVKGYRRFINRYLKSVSDLLDYRKSLLSHHEDHSNLYHNTLSLIAQIAMRTDQIETLKSLQDGLIRHVDIQGCRICGASTSTSGNPDAQRYSCTILNIIPHAYSLSSLSYRR